MPFLSAVGPSLEKDDDVHLVAEEVGLRKLALQSLLSLVVPCHGMAFCTAAELEHKVELQLPGTCGVRRVLLLRPPPKVSVLEWISAGLEGVS